MRHVRSQLASRVRMDMIIDGLRAYMYPLFGENAAYLTRRPVLFQYHSLYAPPQEFIFAVIAQVVAFAGVAFPLCNREDILVIAVGVALYLARNSRGMNANLLCALFFTLFSCQS